MIEDVIITYRADTTDLARARKELGLVDDAQGDILDQFKLVNQAVADQIKLLAQTAAAAQGGTQATGDQAAAIQEVAAALTAEAKAAAAAGQAEAEARRLQAQETRLAAAEAERARRAAKKAADDEANSVGLLGKKLKEINDLKQAKLRILDPEELAEANRQLEKLEAEYRELDTSGTKATKNVGAETGFLGKALAELGPLVAAAFTLDKLIEYTGKIISITAETQKYKAVLTNTLGSQEAAADAMERISTFAAQTPFSIQELTQAYVKLANQGFRPTTAELTKLGDLASSTGKTFDDLAEAILDAQANEFERLKEFGILASKNGEKVTFTFKEQKTTVDASASSIRQYILGLGDLQGVSGSMAAISGTLDGQLSNLGDTIDQLFLAIGNKLSPTISSATSKLNELLQAATKLVAGNKDNTRENLALAASLEPLVARYEALRAQSSRSAAEQTELNKIIAQVAQQLPSTASQYDAYGKAVDISAAKVRAFIAASLNQGDQATQRALTAQRQRYAELEGQIKGVQNALAQVDEKGYVVKAFFDEMGGGFRRLSDVEIKELQDKLDKLFADRKDVGGLIATLKEVGITAKKAGEDLNAGFKSSGGIPGLLKELEDQLKKLQDARPGLFSEASLAANKQAIDQVTEQIRKLNELGTVYGALGLAEKKLADEQRNRSKLSEDELAASNRRVEAYQLEIKRLNELGLATGIVGQIQREMSRINEQIPKLKVEADVTKAYQTLDQLQARLDALRPPKFEMPSVASFLGVLDKALAEQQTYLDKTATQQATYAKEQNLAALQALRAQLESGKLTRAQYDKEVLVQGQILNRDLLANELDTVNKKLKIQDLGDDQRTKLEAERIELQKRLYEQDVDNYAEAQEKKKAIEKELRDAFIQAGADLVNQLFANEAQGLQDRLAAYQEAQQGELAAAGNTADAKGKIDQAYAQKQAEIRKQQNELAQKQAIFNKALAIAQIAMNTAQGITKVIAEVPKFDFGITTGILIAAYAALGAIQVGTVLAQPIPKFAKGTEYVTGGRPGVDSVHALLMPGERVVTVEKNREYKTTLSAIHKGEVPAHVLSQFVLSYKGGHTARFAPLPVKADAQLVASGGDPEFQRQLLQSISERPVNTFIFDAEGSRQYQEHRGNRSRSLNDKYSF